MYYIPALVPPGWLVHKMTLYIDEKTLGVNTGPDKRGKPILNWKETKYEIIKFTNLFIL